MSTPVVEAPQQARLERHRRLAQVMDDLVRVPGTRVTVGLDPVIGLVPGVGDLTGSAISGLVVVEAVRSRVPVPTLARMGANILVDALLGLVPFVGDLLDVAHRAHRKNVLLLERALASGEDRGAPTPGYVAAAVALVVLPLVLGVVIGVVTLVLLVRLVTG